MLKNLLERARETGVQPMQDRPDYDENLGWLPLRDVLPMGAETGAVRSQPRQVFEAQGIELLASDIRENGQLVPIVVRDLGEIDGAHKWGIINGERRYRAMKSIGETRILVRMVPADDRRAYRLSVITDIHNISHTAMERGLSLLECKSDMQDELEGYLSRFGRTPTNRRDRALNDGEYRELRNQWNELPTWVQASIERSELQNPPKRPTVNWEDVALTVGMTGRMINNYIRIAEVARTDREVSAAIGNREINTKHAMALATLPTESARTELLAEVKAEKLSGLETERRARDWENREFRETVSQNVRTLREVRARLESVETLGADVGACAELELLRTQVERLAAG